MVKLATSKIGFVGDNSIDITMKSAKTKIGKLMAPTKSLVYGHKHFMGDNRFSNFAKVNDFEYIEKFTTLFWKRFWDNENEFKILGEMKYITLLCYCKSDKHYCHRFLLAKQILPECFEYLKQPYEYIGEIK